MVFTSRRSNLPNKTLDGGGVHIALIKFSTVTAKSLTKILAFEFLNG